MKRFKNILLFADPSTDVTVSFRRALSLTKQNQAHLTVVDVVDQLPPDILRLITVTSPIELQEILVKERLSQLEKLVKPARKKGIRISAKVLIGTPFLEIIREVLRHHHDLVIKSAEGKTTARNFLFGSIDMHLMRKCPCPVWVIKSSKRKQYARILAAVDPDPFNEEAKEINTLIMDLATSLAMQERSELHIIHAWQPLATAFMRRPHTAWSQGGTDWAAISERKLHKEWLDKLLTDYSLEAIDHHVHLLLGIAGHVISKLANKRVELVVMGTVARTGIPGFLIGNTAEMVLHQVNCSVLTVKPEGFITPVKTAK